MSGPERPEPAVDTTRSLKRKQFSQADQDDLDDLDRVFKRIKAVVPRAPYILSAPSLNPYCYHSRQEAGAWMMGHLWHYDEEHLQYRTYMYREPCQDCLELQAGEDDEPNPERRDSRTSSTGEPAPKKKLNLSAFKVKQVNGTSKPASQKGSPDTPTKIEHDQVNGVKKPDKPPDPARQSGHKSPKRASEDVREDRKATKSDPDIPRPTNRPRAPSQPHKSDSAESKTTIDKSSQSNSTPHGLPPLLSPVHELSTNPYGLPDILSPTLPSNIQEELDRMETQRKRAESNASTSSSDRKSQNLAVPIAKPKEAVKTEPRIRSVSINGKSPGIEVSKPTESKEASLVVKLKFSKAKVPTVRQILKLPSKRTHTEKKERQEPPSKEPQSSSQPKEEDAKKKKPIPKVAARRPDNATSVSTPTVKQPVLSTTASKAPEKRPRTDDDGASAVPAKRPRAASSLERPNTPVQPSTSSPSRSNKSSAQKSQNQYLTPKNSQKAAGMLRTQSTESHDSTPGRSVITPAGSKSEAKHGPTSAPLTGKKQADILLLAQTSMKLNQMGRALKHEATKILQGAGKQVAKQEEKRAAVMNMECILSYMAAYYAQDLSLILRGRSGEVEQTWKTLLPLCLSYARSTKDFKHLEGLRSYLSSVIASAICTHVSQRVATSRPHDSPQDVPHADLAKQHAALVANFALLSDHTNKMNSHYQDARIALPFEDIQSQYKRTFAGREQNARVSKEPEKVSGARMSGPYFLPLSNDTTPIQAVRFGLKFLDEFCEKEKLDYSLRVNLDKPE